MRRPPSLGPCLAAAALAAIGAVALHGWLGPANAMAWTLLLSLCG